MHRILAAIGRSSPYLRLNEKTIENDELVWKWMCELDDRLTGRPDAAVVIQRAWRTHREARRDQAARRIQRACYPWIVRPITGDGKLGINLRLLIGDLHSGF